MTCWVRLFLCKLLALSFFVCTFASATTLSRMENKPKFKYQEQIDKLLALGCQLPELFEPNNIKACRFAFSENGSQNHIPQYMSIFQR